MSRSNRLAAVERKIGYLLAEREDLGKSIVEAEEVAAKLPAMRDRLVEIGTLIEGAKAFIKDDHPDWTGDHLTPIRKWVHKNPIRLGQLTKGALTILRTAEEPLTCREIADKLLIRAGRTEWTLAENDAVSNAVQQAFHKRRGTTLASDESWPERWWVIRPT